MRRCSKHWFLAALGMREEGGWPSSISCSGRGSSFRGAGAARPCGFDCQTERRTRGEGSPRSETLVRSCAYGGFPPLRREDVPGGTINTHRAFLDGLLPLFYTDRYIKISRTASIVLYRSVRNYFPGHIARLVSTSDSSCALDAPLFACSARPWRIAIMKPQSPSTSALGGRSPSAFARSKRSHIARCEDWRRAMRSSRIDSASAPQVTELMILMQPFGSVALVCISSAPRSSRSTTSRELFASSASAT